MKTVSEIIQTEVQAMGFGDFESFDEVAKVSWKKAFFERVAKRYAEQAIERCAEVAYSSESGLSVDQESILNVKTELK